MKRAGAFGYMGALIKPGDTATMRRLRGLFILSVFTWLGLSSALSAGERPVVTAVRTAAHDGVTRFVMEVSEPLTFQVGKVAGQVAVEVPDLEWRTSGKAGLSRAVGVLRNWSYGAGAQGKGRLMLETDGPAGVQKAFIIPPTDGGNYRLVIDLAAGAPMPPPLQTASVAAVSPSPPPPPAPPASPVTATGPKVMAMTSANPILTPVEPAAQEVVPVTRPSTSSNAEPSTAPNVATAPAEGVLKHPLPAPTSQAGGAKVAAGAVPPPLPPKAPPEPEAAPIQAAVTTVAPMPKGKSDGKPVVVVDPGHGGVDPGAISLSGAYEKNIVLALAHDVQDALNKGGKVRCILTRDGDTFIPLRERVALARAHHADLFMSLHADTVTDPAIRGLSVYTLSQTSSDAEAQALADKENKSDIVAGIDLSNESAEVTNILIDLVQRESMNKSAVFAADIIRSVQRETHNVLEANTHRFAGFAVLKAPDIPSVLVENGYLSNVQDEQMLRRSEYRAKLATALARAIEAYFAETRKARKS